MKQLPIMTFRVSFIRKNGVSKRKITAHVKATNRDEIPQVLQYFYPQGIEDLLIQSV